MRVLSNSRYLHFLIASLISGCVAPMEETDESLELGEQIGEVQQAATQVQKDWWKGLWQAHRNARIVARAYQDYNASSPKYVGLQCKPWVQKVVSDASQGVVTIPTTTSGGYGWTWNNSSYVQNLGTTLNGVWAGDIVQMNRFNLNNPHTAIVYWKNATTIWWIDSNWSVEQPDNKVRIHSQTITNFLDSVTFGGAQHYTVYRVTGG